MIRRGLVEWPRALSSVETVTVLITDLVGSTGRRRPPRAGRRVRLRLLRRRGGDRALPPPDRRHRGHPDDRQAPRLLRGDRPAARPAPLGRSAGRGRDRPHRIRVAAAFERTLQTRGCRLVTVLGAPGLGTSRLVNELVKGVAQIGEEDSLCEARAKLDRVLPDVDPAGAVADLIAGAVGLSAAAPSSTDETHWAIRKFLEALAEQQPLLVVLDDMHWGEDHDGDRNPQAEVPLHAAS